MSEPDVISIRGAKEHNLKNVSLDIPKKKLVVFTGVSGSGKSSLAFDTLYAEGQRRYVESLSAYARQFLGQMEKPKYDTIRGLSPTISIEQKAASATTRARRWARSPRSTTTCACSTRPSACSTAPTAARRSASRARSRSSTRSSSRRRAPRCMLLAPLVQNRKGEHKDVLADAQKRGFTRARIDGKVRGPRGAHRARQEDEARHRAGRRPPGAQARRASRGSPTRWRRRCARARASSSSPTRPAAKTPTA